MNASYWAGSWAPESPFFLGGGGDALAQTPTLFGENTFNFTKQLAPNKVLKTLCGASTDLDRDCLNDTQELELARLFAPRLYWDEDEDCGSSNNWNVEARFQVRPIETASGRTVAAWTATDNNLKIVSITYYMNWPLDCGSGPYHIGRHLGDSERFQYEVWTFDMRTFVLVRSHHNHHKDDTTRQGVEILSGANATGSDRPAIAVGQNKHASWWGRDPQDNDCAGNEDSSVDDCFVGDWDQAATNSQYVNMGSPAPGPGLEFRDNIGEPPLRLTLGFDPLTGLPLGQRMILVADGGRIQSELADPTDPSEGRRYFEPSPGSPVGLRPHLTGFLDGQREYWWRPPLYFGKFCGFLCRGSDTRQTNGNCNRSNLPIKPGYTESFGSCSSALSTKLDDSQTEFGYPTASSVGPLVAATCLSMGCNDRAMPSTSSCRCDDACHLYSDCCSDKDAVCGAYDPSSCEGKCGRRWTDNDQVCSCAFECDVRGDCCSDAQSLCSTELANPPADSCLGRCGTMTGTKYDCACDHLCSRRNDCCLDKGGLCPLVPEVTLGSCQNSCFPYYGGAYGGLCHCDPGCAQRGDCCEDAQDECDVTIHPNYSWPAGEVEDAEERFCRFRPSTCRFLKLHYGRDPAFPN